MEDTLHSLKEKLDTIILTEPMQSVTVLEVSRKLDELILQYYRKEETHKSQRFFITRR